MIKDAKALSELAGEWHALRRSLGKTQIHYTASFARGGWMLSAVVDDIYALYLPFGFSVLEHVLQELRDQGSFLCKSSQLKAIMHASKPVVPWRDFDFIDDAREMRNRLTHEQTVPTSKQTFQTLDKIEEELIAWGVLEGPVKYEFSLSVTPAT